MKRFALPMLAMLAVMPAMATPPGSIPAYLRLFDRNGDGRVSLAEYEAYMEQGFHRMDRNGDGVLEVAEMPPSRRHREPLTLAHYRRNLAAAFQRQDRNHDGYLDAREMASPPR